MNRDFEEMPKWIRPTLKLAGFYNLAWGLAVIAFPSFLFNLADMAQPRYPQIWQCVGMIVGVYGVGYLIAAPNPYRHWPIVFVGFLGKIFGPIGFLFAASRGDLPWMWGLTIVTNDLVWWIPFAAILYHSFRFNTDSSSDEPTSQNAATGEIQSQRGATIRALSNATPTLVVFLRHSGCTFCREALADLARCKSRLVELNVTLAVVHMSPPIEATQLFERHGLSEVHRFSDPTCQIYRSFGLRRGKLLELFGPYVWKRAIEALGRGFGIGSLSGDGFRMPGAYVVRNGTVLGEFVAETAADRPDYLRLVEDWIDSASCATPSVKEDRHDLALSQ